MLKKIILKFKKQDTEEEGSLAVLEGSSRSQSFHSLSSNTTSPIQSINSPFNHQFNNLLTITNNQNQLFVHHEKSNESLSILSNQPYPISHKSMYYTKSVVSNECGDLEMGSLKTADDDASMNPSIVKTMRSDGASMRALYSTSISSRLKATNTDRCSFMTNVSVDVLQTDTTSIYSN